MEIIHSCSPKLDVFYCHMDNLGYEKLFFDILKTNRLMRKIIVPIINKMINRDFFFNFKSTHRENLNRAATNYFHCELLCNQLIIWLMKLEKIVKLSSQSPEYDAFE